jgi:hypothetical protein
MIACGARAPGDVESATPTAVYYGALTNAFADRPKSRRLPADRALRLSPFDPRAVEAHFALGIAAVSEGRYEDAVSCFARAFEINPNHSLMPFFHPIGLALARRAVEAQPSLERGF